MHTFWPELIILVIFACVVFAMLLCVVTCVLLLPYAFPRGGVGTRTWERENLIKGSKSQGFSGVAMVLVMCCRDYLTGSHEILISTELEIC